MGYLFKCALFSANNSEAEEATAHLSEAEAKLDASEACRRDLEGRLSLLQKKSENALGEERLKVTVLNLYTVIAGGRLTLSLIGQAGRHGREPVSRN